MSESFDDAEGFLWTDQAYVRRGSGQVKQDPIEALKKRLSGMAFSDAYAPPALLNPPPGLLAFDVETEDPDLTTIGSSWALGRGTIIGFSVAFKIDESETYSAYFPLRHISSNVDERAPLSWLKAQAKRTDIKFVCANAPYDMGWLRQEIGFYPKGGVCDVQHMAAILDEFSLHYSLEHISQVYVGSGKVTSRLDELERQLGVKHAHLMACLKYLPGPVVGPYAAGDAVRTLQCYNAMMPKILKQGLLKIFDLESSLICMTVEMRRVGIRVNVEAAEQASHDIKNRRMPELMQEIKRLTGTEVSPWEADSCYEALTQSGVSGIAKTKDGNWSINAELLNREAPRNKIAAYILLLRKMSKISGTFIDGHILRHQVSGRLHAQFNQLRSERDEGSSFGTVTARFSATGPALQQIPVRDPEWGPLIRGFFLPEEDEELVSRDYSSQEPRMAVHFAAMIKLPGSAEAVQMYHKNPKTSYHRYVADLAKIEYNSAKTINLALAYGAGQAKIARALKLPTQWMRISNSQGRQQWDKIDEATVSYWRSKGFSCVEVAGDEAKKVIEAWEKGAPFVKGLYKYAKEVADDRGFILTILRRRCRFQEERGGQGYSMTYKAMNKLCQSSSADQTKAAMALLWNEGIIPKLPIHDELLSSEPRSNRDKPDRVKEMMEQAINLCIPTVVDVKRGDTWGAIPK